MRTTNDKLLSLADAGRELGLHRTRILQLINDGILPAFKVGRAYAVWRSDLDRVRERSQKDRGRPLKTMKKGNGK
jgi:excisionase family DNA binding protein